MTNIVTFEDLILDEQQNNEDTISSFERNVLVLPLAEQQSNDSSLSRKELDDMIFSLQEDVSDLHDLNNQNQLSPENKKNIRKLAQGMTPLFVKDNMYALDSGVYILKLDSAFPFSSNETNKNSIKSLCGRIISFLMIKASNKRKIKKLLRSLRNYVIGLDSLNALLSFHFYQTRVKTTNRKLWKKLDKLYQEISDPNWIMRQIIYDFHNFTFNTPSDSNIQIDKMFKRLCQTLQYLKDNYLNNSKTLIGLSIGAISISEIKIGFGIFDALQSNESLKQQDDNYTINVKSFLSYTSEWNKDEMSKSKDTDPEKMQKILRTLLKTNSGTKIKVNL